ncbi:MAG: winged helix-turn-helix transcriptional regulator [Alphaproteobacteria bacterium]
MSRSDLATQICTCARTIELLGNEWTLMVLRELFLGSRRFDEMQSQTGASPHTLSQRLKRLEREGILRRETYSTRPPRHEYRLTAKGRDLWPVIIAMKNWGDCWFEEGGTPVEIRHKGCGAKVAPRMTCPDCGERMHAHDAEPRLSPEFEHARDIARSQS